MPDLNRLLALSDFEKLALIESLRTAAHAYRLLPDTSDYTPNSTGVNSPLYLAGRLDRLADTLQEAAGVYLA